MRAESAVAVPSPCTSVTLSPCAHPVVGLESEPESGEGDELERNGRPVLIALTTATGVVAGGSLGAVSVTFAGALAFPRMGGSYGEGIIPFAVAGFIGGGFLGGRLGLKFARGFGSKGVSSAPESTHGSDGISPDPRGAPENNNDWAYVFLGGTAGLYSGFVAIETSSTSLWWWGLR